MRLNQHSLNHFYELGLEEEDYFEYLGAYHNQQTEGKISVDEERIGKIVLLLYGEQE